MKGKDILQGLQRAGASFERAIAFMRFHNARPEIWREFEKRMGQKLDELEVTSQTAQISAKLVWEEMRRDPAIGKPGQYKLPNEMTAFYSHTFCMKWPNLAKYIKRKRLT